MSASRKPWAALFDWDGVIIDSAAAHERSWERLAEENRFPLPEDHFLLGFGMRNEVIIPEILRWTTDPYRIRALSLRKESLYREVIRDEGVTPLPGVEPYLQSLHLAGIPCVVGTSTHLANVETILDVLQFHRYFQDIVSSEDVRRGKPDPEVFLLAARKAGTDPENCVVFEDAHHGIQAAKSAGMKAVGVLTTHPGGKLAGADRLVTRLDELPLDGSPPV
ncbi:MAG: HAD family phosphatase [Kiritimatiellae bacterium]|nr:HAD family phosphatase [Kiritimatiellia bacterium]